MDETDSETTQLVFQAEDVDNAATFSATTNDISSRPVTAASVAWSPPQWSTVGESGPDQRTTDIASVIQEIVDRQPVGDQTGWVSGNSLVIIITGTGKRVAESYEGGSPPLLHVEYIP